MTAETAPGQAGAMTGGPAEPGVITRAIGAFALASLIKNNQARPVRRVVHWYNVRGEIPDMKVLHHARQAVKPDKR